jgi:hypothetical protein
MERDKYFYCYNINVSNYLTSKGIKYITVAREPKSNKLFSLYKITNGLQQAMQEYKQLNKK